MPTVSIILVVLAALVVLYFLYLTVRSEEMQRWNNVGLLVLLVIDAWCVTVVFPSLPGVTVRIGYVDALSITVLNAATVLSVLARLQQGTIAPRIELLYSIFGPLTNAGMLIFWTWLVPSLGLARLWPDALIAGLILHFLDVSVMRPLTRSLIRRMDLKH